MSEGGVSPTGVFFPGRDGDGGLARFKSCWDVVVGGFSKDQENSKNWFSDQGTVLTKNELSLLKNDFSRTVFAQKSKKMAD